MSKVFIEETTLTAIADSIRGKEGTTDLVPVNDMATRITNLPSGGGGGNEPTDEELTLTGNCANRFAYSGWDWFLNKYGNRITTKDITTATSMFDGCKLEEIPFQINIKNNMTMSALFKDCTSLEVCPKIRGTIEWTTSTNLENLIYGCRLLRDMEDLFTPEMFDGFSTVKVTSAYSVPKRVNAQYCLSLRSVPSWWYKQRLNPESTTFPNYGYSLYNGMFSSCYALDEVRDIPVWKCQAAQTRNMFSYSLLDAARVNSVTFETNEDGSPIVVDWKSQTIDLSSYVGYASSPVNITYYNSGITDTTKVTDDATYQALKNDPDWWTINLSYSRYNHDSAVETINSLPDTSAYLATAGGTNTIKFKGDAGSATDGGAINTLTEEEIAVATAKGWTVTLV